MSSSSNKIVLKSSDDQTFEIEEAVARELQIISHMIDDDCAGKAIPLQNVTGKILAMVIEYCKKHVEETEEDQEAKKTTLDAYDADFIKLDLDTLFELVVAANYLNNKSLLDLCCQAVADLIKEKSVEEVRDIFKIQTDYTPEEEAEVRKENAWAFEP